MDQYVIYGKSKARHRVLTALEMITPSNAESTPIEVSNAYKADEAAAAAQNAADVAAKAAQATTVASAQQQVNTPTEEDPPDLILLAGHQLLTL
jgi:hypothetical protein